MQTYITSLYILIIFIENAIIMRSYMHTCHFIVLNNLYLLYLLYLYHKGSENKDRLILSVFL